jgi:acyl-CoA thioesterase
MPDYEDLSPNFKRALLKRIKTKQPFWKLLGIQLIDVKKGWAQLRLPFSEKLVHPYGIVHGGASFSLADSAVAMALLGLVDKDEQFTTVEMKINYIRPVDQGEITAEAIILEKGEKIALGDVTITNNQGRLVAKCLATYMIMKRNA